MIIAVRSVSGGRASVCPALSGPEDQLTAALLAKMNVLRGLDIPATVVHGRKDKMVHVSGGRATAEPQAASTSPQYWA